MEDLSGRSWNVCLFDKVGGFDFFDKYEEHSHGYGNLLEIIFVPKDIVQNAIYILKPLFEFDIKRVVWMTVWKLGGRFKKHLLICCNFGQ